MVTLISTIPLGCNVVLTYPLGGGWERAGMFSSNLPPVLSHWLRTDQGEHGHA